MNSDPSTTKSRERRWLVRIAITLAAIATLPAQTTFNWQQIRDKFEAANPTLKAAQLGIDESKAAEITAYLRPNPDFTGTLDQISPFAAQLSPSGSGQSVYRPFANTLPIGSLSYLHERQNKRELRRDTA